MAQTGFTPIQIYRSSTASAAPTSGNLVAGELAINTADGKLFYLDNLNAVQVIGWKLVPATAGGTGLSTYTTGDIIYSNATNTLTKLSVGSTGQVLTVAGGVPTWAAAGGGGLTVNTTTITGGTSGRILYDNAGTVGELANTGTGNNVLADSPTITTALTVTGALQLTGSATVIQNIASSQTSGTLNIGGTAATAALNLGQSTSTQPINIGGTGNGAITIGRSSTSQTVSIANGTNAGALKTVNIAVGGSSTGSRIVNIARNINGSGPDTTVINIGDNNAVGQCQVNINSTFKQTILTVTDLYNNVTILAGMRAIVNDALAPIFGAIVNGGGGVTVPVYCDGTDWRVG